MHVAKALTWAYAEDFVEPDEVLVAAVGRATELGAHATSSATGALLRVLARATSPRAVVEIGTGTGVAALWLLRGMADDAVLTTIDAEVDHHRAAKQAFAEAGIRATRTRVITGRPAEVVPRLTDGAYDLVLVNPSPRHDGRFVDEAIRLLRPGGLFLLDAALWHDHVADPARRDETTTAVREIGKQVRGDERVLTALLPVGDGLLLAARR